MLFFMYLLYCRKNCRMVTMKYLEKHPMIMIVIGIIGISLSSILVKFSTAPSAVTAAWRLTWTVILMTPVVLGNQAVRKELFSVSKRTVMLSCISGLFLAIHFVVWFESLQHTSVASSTTIVCTEVIWVALGYCIFLKGKLSAKPIFAIAVTFAGSVLIAFSDSTGAGLHLYGDFLALIAAIAVAVYTLLGRIVRQDTSTSVYTYLVYVSCALVLLAMCLWQGSGMMDYGISAVAVGLLLSVFSTILGHSIFSWCLKFFSPSFVSASKLCEPVAAALMAAFLFAEYPRLLQIVGSILILVGVLFYSRLEREKT